MTDWIDTRRRPPRKMLTDQEREALGVAALKFYRGLNIRNQDAIEISCIVICTCIGAEAVDDEGARKGAQIVGNMIASQFTPEAIAWKNEHMSNAERAQKSDDADRKRAVASKESKHE